MFKIVKKERLASNIVRLEVEAPYIARKRKPGQFIVVRVNESGERIPLTIADSDTEKGTITLIVQEVGKTTFLIGDLEEGDAFSDVIGPLGVPTHIEKFGTVVCVGGGVGTAVVYPIAKGMKDAGNRVIFIIGARSKDLLILEDEAKALTDEVIITTDDGSYGKKGFVTDALKEVIDREKVDMVVAIGPAIMMKAVSDLTRGYGIKTIVSLNSIMVDGTGMCGACRVTVAGQTRFACIDGPEFDGHQVDFEELLRRQRMYLEEEKIALQIENQDK